MGNEIPYCRGPRWEPCCTSGEGIEEEKDQPEDVTVIDEVVIVADKDDQEKKKPPARELKAGMRVQIKNSAKVHNKGKSLGGIKGEIRPGDKAGCWNLIIDGSTGPKQKVAKDVPASLLEPLPPDEQKKDEQKKASGGSRTGSKGSKAGDKDKRDKPEPEPEEKEEVQWRTGAELQRFFGPQSKRGKALQFQLDILQHCKNKEHAVACFDTFFQREEEYCGEWAAQYHSYSVSGLLYEVNAAIATVLFGLAVGQAPLPRLHGAEFLKIPDAKTLQKKFRETYANNKKDHHDEYRAVGISTMCSLVAVGPEVSTPVMFAQGYKHSDDMVPFRDTLEQLMASLVDKNKKAEAKKTVEKIVKEADHYGLDTSLYGGKSGDLQSSGHMLQIFIKRDLVDELCYASLPWGDTDEERQPLSKWLDADSNTSVGQARIVARPEIFVNSDKVRLFVASADEKFHKSRGAFQASITRLMKELLPNQASISFAKKALKLP
eukprot:TRINITY_DN13607_c0_g1_i1.p1 TRINITY_DN13607_c0_g1~~TRINITY_DN13607_c0_g1_i1.p1  ORF type:complete len:490 (-),score=143.70 TRINITY_DN13607_c0_g1_i1:330-1799(-)